MEALNTIIQAFVLAVVGLLLGLQTRSVRTEVAELRRELHEEVRALRSDLTNVALAVGAAPAPRPAGRSGRTTT